MSESRPRWIMTPVARPPVTLAGLIGGGGYGEPIQSGLQLNDNATILQGAIPAALLALLVQGAFTALDRAVIPRGLRLYEEVGSGRVGR